MKVDGDFQGYGPAVLLAFSPGAGHPQVFWALKDHPEVGEQPGPYRFTVESIPLGYYSVFQVKHDPGVGWVYAGFLLFLPGLYWPSSGRWSAGPWCWPKPPKANGRGACWGPAPATGRNSPPARHGSSRSCSEGLRHDQPDFGHCHVGLSPGGHLVPDGGVMVVSPAQECGPDHAVAGTGMQTGALLGRWWESYHLALGHSPTTALADKLQLIILQVPLSNFYESLIFFSWCLPALGLLAFRRSLKGYLGALVALLSTLLPGLRLFSGWTARSDP